MTIQERRTPAVAKAKPTPLERFLALPSVQHTKAYPCGYRMLCPAHQDTKESLMGWEDESDGHVAVFCWANCQQADICAALGIRESDLYNDAHPPRPRPERKLDLLDIVLDKLIHPGLLLSVGVEDSYTWKSVGRSAFREVGRIPYLQEDGSAYRRNRIRMVKTTKSGFYREREEVPIISHGLWKLAESWATRMLWLVEHDIEVDAQAALMDLSTANVSPVIFIRRGMPTRFRRDEEARPLIEEINESILLCEMARSANIHSYNQARETYGSVYLPLSLDRRSAGILPQTAYLIRVRRKRVSWEASDRNMERTKKTNLVVQDRYATPPGFGAKHAKLTQSEQAKERHNRSVYSIAIDYKKALGTTMPTEWTRWTHLNACLNND